MNTRTPLLSPSLLAWLRCFEATARHGSFTRAADELCVTQGAVSQQVRQLEQWLGRPLLRRAPRALAPTAEGQRLGAVLHESLQAIEQALAALRQVPGAGPVVLSCSPSFAMAWLTPRLGSFFQQHPQTGLRVQAEFHALDRQRMRDDGVDAALRFDLGAYPDLYARPLLDEWLVPVASPAFVAAHPGLCGPGDLTADLLLHDSSPWDGAAPHAEWAHWFACMGLAAPDWAAGRIYNLSMLAQSAACAGQGVALGHTALIGDDLARGRLLPLFGCRVPAQARYVFVCPPGSQARLAPVEQWLLAQARAFDTERQDLLAGLRGVAG
ncbi:MAG: LysR substrate-binding domain-containing protein [Comamonas sp.]